MSTESVRLDHQNLYIQHQCAALASSAASDLSRITTTLRLYGLTMNPRNDCKDPDEVVLAVSPSVYECWEAFGRTAFLPAACLAATVLLLRLPLARLCLPIVAKPGMLEKTIVYDMFLVVLYDTYRDKTV